MTSMTLSSRIHLLPRLCRINLLVPSLPSRSSLICIHTAVSHICNSPLSTQTMATQRGLSQIALHRATPYSTPMLLTADRLRMAFLRTLSIHSHRAVDARLVARSGRYSPACRVWGFLLSCLQSLVLPETWTYSIFALALYISRYKYIVSTGGFVVYTNRVLCLSYR